MKKKDIALIAGTVGVLTLAYYGMTFEERQPLTASEMEIIANNVAEFPELKPLVKEYRSDGILSQIEATKILKKRDELRLSKAKASLDKLLAQ